MSICIETITTDIEKKCKSTQQGKHWKTSIKWIINSTWHTFSLTAHRMCFCQQTGKPSRGHGGSR